MRKLGSTIRLIFNLPLIFMSIFYILIKYYRGKRELTQEFATDTVYSIKKILSGGSVFLIGLNHTFWIILILWLVYKNVLS